VCELSSVQTAPFFVTFAGYVAPSMHAYVWGGGGLHITFGGQCVTARLWHSRMFFVMNHSPSLVSGGGGFIGGGTGFSVGGGGLLVGRGGFAMIVGVCVSGGGGVGCGSACSGWPGAGCVTDCEGGVDDW